MNLVGDVERLFATSLYPLRVPIAIGFALALIGAIVVAWRRGWVSAARRHPGRTSGLAAAALAIGLPVAWYLGSPLFIRTQLIEPAPVAVAESTPPAAPTPANSDTSASPVPASADASPATSPTPIAFVPSVLATGPFQGADEFHFGKGTASIVEIAPGRYTLWFDDFSVRNGPDLHVYLSADADGYADGALEIGTLKATEGAFGYELPEGTDPTGFGSAIVWCKQFAVLFAVAPLVPA